MLTDWTHWLLSLRPDELWWVLFPIWLLDIPRYTVGAVFICVWDMVSSVINTLRGRPNGPSYDHCPSVCVVVAGLNESDTVCQTLGSLWGSYPNMEIIVVDDGSTDGMADVAQQFASEHEGILVLRKPQRGGKSSALNFSLPFVTAEVIVCVDSDSHLTENAIWEIVQPFKNPKVGAVSGTVLARNPFVNFVTWFQALEYLRSIFIGRMLSDKLDIMGIISGAFGAYRREAISRQKGWDVGPGEDGDLSLRLRKSGYRIAFAPYAQCMTNLPTSLWRLVLQRRRWEWAIITFECRKHIDMGNPFSRNFRFSNLLLLVDRWVSSLFLVFLFWGYVIWICFHPYPNMAYTYFTIYLVYCMLEAVTMAVIMFYSTNRRRDMIIGLLSPMMPFYHTFQRGVTLWAILEETFTRRSYRDRFVPEHVRKVTWHW